MSLSLVELIVVVAHCISATVELPGSRGYHDKVIDHYENPRNVGSLDKNDVNVGTGLVGAPACGDVMKLQVDASFAFY